MDERYIAAIDLGTSKIAVTVALISGKDVQVIYYHETPSEGVRNSYVFNPKKVSGPLGEAISRAENELKIKIHQAVVNLPRYEVSQKSACARLDRSDADSSITQEEIDYLKSNAIDSYPLDNPDKEMMYGVVAQSFTAEDNFNVSESELEGIVSDTIDGNFKVFVGRKRHSDNVDMAMNHIGVAVARKYFPPDVTAKAVLSREERENGVALIEFGAGATSVTVYHNNILRHYSSIPFGGKTITNDIKHECGISEQLAENIKIAYGACCPDKLLTLREKIIQINNEESGTCKQLSVKYLSEIITARIKEIVDACLYRIEESGFADTLRNGVVITGGGASIPNLSSFIKEISGYTVRLGYPVHKFSCSGCNEVRQKSAVASVGMVLAAKDNKYINCLSEAPVRKDAVTVIAPPEQPAAEEPEPLSPSPEDVREMPAVTENPAEELQAAGEQSFTEPSSAAADTSETADTVPPVEETKEDTVGTPAEEEVNTTSEPEPVQQADQTHYEEPAAPKEEPVKKKSKFKITWAKPLEKFGKKIGGAITNAIDIAYDNSNDKY